MEKKEVKKLPDFNKVFAKLKQTNAANKALTTQVAGLSQDLAQMKRLNKELADLLHGLKTAGACDRTTADRISTVCRQFKIDEINVLTSFVLDGEEVDVTYSQMKGIVRWYEKGHVYFEQNEKFRVKTDKVHVFTFGEICDYVDRVDSSKRKEVVVVGEDANTVDVCFLADYDRDNNGVIRPTHVLKSRIEKKPGEIPSFMIDKRTLMVFLLNAGYTNMWNDETAEYDE